MGVADDEARIAGNGSVVSSFRDLRVWKATVDLVQAVYLLTQGFPRGEMYGLSLQMQRAAVSVPSNIAERYAREHLREYLHSLSIAQGSLAELETQVEIAVRLGYTTSERGSALMRQIVVSARQLRALRHALERRLPSARGRNGVDAAPTSPIT
jgi:four helix bundle protein